MCASRECREGSAVGTLGRRLPGGAGVTVAARLDVHAARAALAVAMHKHHPQGMAAARTARVAGLHADGGDGVVARHGTAKRRSATGGSFEAAGFPVDRDLLLHLPTDGQIE